MRLIDADVLKESLKESRDNCILWLQDCKEAKSQKWIGRAEQALMTFNECLMRIDTISTIEPERRTGKWIPCSERLPDRNGEYLVTTKEGEVYQDTLQFLCQWDDCGDDVIAWMPLPKPYQEDNQ